MNAKTLPAAANLEEGIAANVATLRPKESAVSKLVNAGLDKMAEEMDDKLAEHHAAMVNDWGEIERSHDAWWENTKRDANALIDQMAQGRANFMDGFQRGSAEIQSRVADWATAGKRFVDTLRAGDGNMRKALDGK